MRKQNKFIPSFSRLESRVALSHASVMVGGMSNLQFTIRGAETTTLPAGVGGESTAVLNGNARIRQVGRVSFHGTLNDNASLPPPFSNTHGEFTFTTKNGSVTLYMHASPMDLAPKRPTPTHFTFDVDSATGAYASAVGHTGTADLVLVTRGRPRNGMVNGRFLLTLSPDA